MTGCVPLAKKAAGWKNIASGSWNSQRDRMKLVCSKLHFAQFTQTKTHIGGKAISIITFPMSLCLFEMSLLYDIMQGYFPLWCFYVLCWIANLLLINVFPYDPTSLIYALLCISFFLCTVCNLWCLICSNIKRWYLAGHTEQKVLAVVK